MIYKQLTLWDTAGISSDNKFKFIDLFCGMGGFRLAFEQNDCKCVFSSDIDPFVQKTYFSNFNEVPFGDIKQAQESDIPDHDILCAGFPCQSFSIAGKRLGFNDTRGTLFFDVARILKAKKPKAFILENVKGITNHDNGKTLQTILNTLSDIGYVFKYSVLNAKDFNVPQNRERWYCIGFRKDLGNCHDAFNFPEPLELTNTLKNIIEESAPAEYYISETCSKNIAKYLKEKNISIKSDTLAYEVRASRCQFKNDGIAPCLTAKMGTGGNNVPIIVNQNRKLTEQECLSIMGYPKNYKVSKGAQTYKQIGNSVVVPIIKLLAKQIVEVLKKEG